MLLEALGLALGFLERRAFRQPKVDQDLGTVGGRKELLWDEGEARDAGDERGEVSGPPRSAADERTKATKSPDRAIRTAVEDVVVAPAPLS